MRTILFIFIILISGCRRNTIENSLYRGMDDTISVKLFSERISDTIIKVSKPFIINQIECYWKHELRESKINIQIRDYITDKILMEDSFYIYYPIDHTAAYYFETLNHDSFKDVNFDGLTDVIYRSYGSTALSDEARVYLYDNVTK